MEFNLAHYPRKLISARAYGLTAGRLSIGKRKVKYSFRCKTRDCDGDNGETECRKRRPGSLPRETENSCSREPVLESIK